jgi:protein phosphatase PTC7
VCVQTGRRHHKYFLLVFNVLTCHSIEAGLPVSRCAGLRVHAAAVAQALILRTGSCSLPHPEKLDTGGEDAFFISSDSCVMGVADGVGGWRESGIDPGDYSRTLMRTACDYFDSGEARRRPSDNTAWEETLREALAVAHQKTRMPGSATACILGLNATDRYISAANLGDSGFIVVRNGTVVFQTPPLQHFFDCPLQLGAYPEHVEATDFPSDAQTYTLNVMPGDVIVMGSDGVWDNCPLAEIVQLLPDDDASVDNAAEMIAAAAREHAGARLAPRTARGASYIRSHACGSVDMPAWLAGSLAPSRATPLVRAWPCAHVCLWCVGRQRTASDTPDRMHILRLLSAP